MRGEFIALFGAFIISLGQMSNTTAGRRLGAPDLIRVSVLFALAANLLVHMALYGTFLPVYAAPERWFWLVTSGVVGVVISFNFMTRAFILIGARLTALVVTIAPVISAGLAWFFLDETLAVQALAGIGLAISGIVWVLLERPPDTQDMRWHGVLMALIAALAQAISLTLAKRGLEGDFSAQSASTIRMLSGAVVWWTLALLGGKVTSTIRNLRDHPQAYPALGASILFTPILSVWLRMLALQRAPVGVANTILNLSPIILIPISALILREQITRRAITGTLIAVSGTALLFLWPA